jgi:hypothetical protein
MRLGHQPDLRYKKIVIRTFMVDHPKKIDFDFPSFNDLQEWANKKTLQFIRSKGKFGRLNDDIVIVKNARYY